MVRKCEVVVDRCSLVVGKGSIVYVDDRQFELARNFIKPVDMPKAKEEVANEVDVEEKPKKKSSKK